MTVKISDEHLAFAQEMAPRKGFADVGAYLESLIDRAMKGKIDVTDGCDPAYVVEEVAQKRDLKPAAGGAI